MNCCEQMMETVWLLNAIDSWLGECKPLLSAMTARGSELEWLAETLVDSEEMRAFFAAELERGIVGTSELVTLATAQLENLRACLEICTGSESR